MCETPDCVTHIKCTESIRRPHLCRVFIVRTSILGMQRTTDYLITRQPSQKYPHASASHQNIQFSYGPKLTPALTVLLLWIVMASRHRCHTRADRTSSGTDDLDSVRARRSVPKTRQYAASMLLSSRVPCLRCLFHANKFSKDLWEWNLSCKRNLILEIRI